MIGGGLGTVWGGLGMVWGWLGHGMGTVWAWFEDDLGMIRSGGGGGEGGRAGLIGIRSQPILPPLQKKRQPQGGKGFKRDSKMGTSVHQRKNIAKTPLFFVDLLRDHRVCTECRIPWRCFQIGVVLSTPVEQLLGFVWGLLGVVWGLLGVVWRLLGVVVGC